MKIAIFSPYATVVPHFETELEIAQSHLEQEHSVEYIGCYGKLANCDFNLTGEISRCQDCIGRRRAGLSLLHGEVRQTELSAIGQLPDIPHFEDMEEMKKFSIAQCSNTEINYDLMQK